MTPQIKLCIAISSRDVTHVACLRTDVQNWRANRHDVVDLARMHDAGKLFTHHNRVQVRGRERLRQLIQWLVRQTFHITEPMLCGKPCDLCLLATAANEAESKLIAVNEQPGCLTQS